MCCFCICKHDFFFLFRKYSDIHVHVCYYFLMTKFQKKILASLKLRKIFFFLVHKNQFLKNWILTKKMLRGTNKFICSKHKKKVLKFITISWLINECHLNAVTTTQKWKNLMTKRGFIQKINFYVVVYCVKYDPGYEHSSQLKFLEPSWFILKAKFISSSTQD